MPKSTPARVHYSLRAMLIKKNGRTDVAEVSIPPYPAPVAGFGPPEFLDQVHSARLLSAYRALEHLVCPRGPRLPKHLRKL